MAKAHYSRAGKLLTPITEDEFKHAIDILKPKYQAYAIFIYYTGVRVSEALRLYRKDFSFEGDRLYVEIGQRLKHGKTTPPLPLDLQQPYMDLLAEYVNKTQLTKRVFPFSRQTAWRQIANAGLGYNHHARLSTITAFLKAGYSIAHIVNWFGVSVQTVNDYIGRVGLEEMATIQRIGESLKKKWERSDAHDQ